MTLLNIVRIMRLQCSLSCSASACLTALDMLVHVNGCHSDADAQYEYMACSDVYIAYLAWLLVTAGMAFMVYRYGTRKLR